MTTQVRWTWWVSLVAIAAVAALALLANFVAGAFACSFDTSYCADSRDELGVVHGMIVDEKEQPVGGVEFHLTDDTYPRDDPGPVFVSNPDGRFCVLWPEGSTRPFAQPLDPTLRSTLVEPASIGFPPPGPCQTTDRRAAWYRYEDLESNWQYLTLTALPASAFALVLGAGTSIRRRPQRAGVFRLTASVLVALNVVLFLMLWNVV